LANKNIVPEEAWSLATILAKNNCNIYQCADLSVFVAPAHVGNLYQPISATSTIPLTSLLLLLQWWLPISATYTSQRSKSRGAS
jgi:hypothetical protein